MITRYFIDDTTLVKNSYSNPHEDRMMMNEDPKEEKFDDQYLGLSEVSSRKPKSSLNKFNSFWNTNTLQIIAGSVQIMAGMSIVGITILGLLQPLWIAAILSMLGSVSSMFGVYMIFQSVSSTGKFDTLINQSIKRVIRDQN